MTAAGPLTPVTPGSSGVVTGLPHPRVVRKGENRGPNWRNPLAKKWAALPLGGPPGPGDGEGGDRDAAKFRVRTGGGLTAAGPPTPVAPGSSGDVTGLPHPRVVRKRKNRCPNWKKTLAKKWAALPLGGPPGPGDGEGWDRDAARFRVRTGPTVGGVGEGGRPGCCCEEAAPGDGRGEPGDCREPGESREPGDRREEPDDDDRGNR